MDYAIERKRPEKCKAPNVLREVEVLGGTWLDIEWPIEGGKFGRHIIQRRRIIDTRTEMGSFLANIAHNTDQDIVVVGWIGRYDDETYFAPAIASSCYYYYYHTFAPARNRVI